MSDLSGVAAELEAEARRLLDLAGQIRREAQAPEDPEVSAAEPARLLEAREAAELLSITPKRLYELTARPGGPPHVRLGERSMRWPLRALEEWLAERSSGP